MNLYIASPLRGRHAAARLAEGLRAHGHRIVSSWHDDPMSTGPDPENPRLRRNIAARCIEDLRQAQGLIVRLHSLHKPRGTIYEAGYFDAMRTAHLPGIADPRTLWVRSDVEAEWPTVFDCLGDRITTTDDSEVGVVAEFIRLRWLDQPRAEGSAVRAGVTKEEIEA